MSLFALHCGKCKAQIYEVQYNREGFSPCPACNSLIHLEAFPALNRPLPAGPATELIVGEDEASCFYHPASKAVVPCQSCGRFLCGLCDCQIRGEHFCPACLDTGKQKGRMKNLENRRMLYDNLALCAAIFPALLCLYPSIIGAPLSLFVAIRYWKAPGSILPRTRIRSILAIIIALAELLFWLFAIGSIVFFTIKNPAHHG